MTIKYFGDLIVIFMEFRSERSSVVELCYFWVRTYCEKFRFLYEMAKYSRKMAGYDKIIILIFTKGRL